MSKDLDYYLTTWELSNPQKIADTPTSHVYTVEANSETVILKILTPIGQEDEQHGAVALRYFDGHGAVRLLHDDEQAHLLEYASGNDLVKMVQQGRDGQATYLIASVLKQLHSKRPTLPTDGLIPLKTWFRSLFQKAESEPEESIFVWGAAVAKVLLDKPQDIRVLHGDIHHQNIRKHKRGWLAFDPKGLLGERTYDAANVLYNPVTIPELVGNGKRFSKMAQKLAYHLDLEVERLMAFTFAYGCLSASWLLAENKDASLTLRVASLAETHLHHIL